MIELAKSPEWHQERLQGIGASEASSIVGLGKQTPRAIWEIKVGDAQPPDLSDRSEIVWGTVFEDFAAKLLQLERPTWVIRRRNLTVWSNEYPFAFAHLDRTVNDGEHAGIPCEIKTAAYPDHWGESGTEDIPEYHYPQIQHEIAVTNKPYAYCVAMIFSTRELRIYKIMRNDEYIARLMEREEAFWDCVEQRVPPAPINADEIIAMFPDPTGTIDATDDALAKSVRYLEINRMLASLNEEKGALRDSFSLIFGEHDTLAYGQRTIATFKRTKTTHFDQQRFQRDHPELFEEYVEHGYTRTLNVKKK